MALFKPKCECGGESGTFWLKRLVWRDRFVYTVQGDNRKVGRHIESTTGETIANVVTDEWMIYRNALIGDPEAGERALCWCGRWIHPDDTLRNGDSALTCARYFADARIAEQYARRYAYGIPQAWEWPALIAFAAIEFAIAAIVKWA